MEKNNLVVTYNSRWTSVSKGEKGQGRQKQDVFSILGGKMQLISHCNKLCNTVGRNIFRLNWKVQKVQVLQYSVPLPSQSRGHYNRSLTASINRAGWLPGRMRSIAGRWRGTVRASTSHVFHSPLVTHRCSAKSSPQALRRKQRHAVQGNVQQATKQIP